MLRPHPSRRLAVGLALALCAALPARAGEAAATPTTFALRARLVFPCTPEQPGPLANAVVVVRDGKIVAVGADAEVPPGVPMVHLRDEVICPGFVSASGALGGMHRGDESVSGLFAAIDAFDAYGDYGVELSRGTTTAHLAPGPHRLVAGRSAVVKLGGPRDSRVLSAQADLAINLGVFEPPALAEAPFYASSDVAIEPAKIQRPQSRLGQLLELHERTAEAQRWLTEGAAARRPPPSAHLRAFAAAWQAKLPLRVELQRAADVPGAISFARGAGRPAYLIGLAEGATAADELLESGLPLVLRIAETYRGPAGNVGPNPEALEFRLATAGALSRAAGRLALAGRVLDTGEDLQMVAAAAIRGGLTPEQALAGITRVPAEILGVADRVGSLAPGKDADLLVLSGSPGEIGSHVRRAYVSGKLEFEARAAETLVVKAGTVWVGNGQVLTDASVLVQGGKIRAVGQRVPHPPDARVIDAGRSAFVTPGFIDAHGHLGLGGDGQVIGPELPISAVIGAAGREFLRVARAGITTVALAAYRPANNGSRVAAIKTYGRSREELIARDVTGVKLSLVGRDAQVEVENLRRVLEAGKKYDETWKKYAADLAEWEKDKNAPAAKPKTEETVVEGDKPDPITGTWRFTVSGGPIPEPVSGNMQLRLTGTTIEGRIEDPIEGESAPVSGRLDGNQVTLEVDTDTPVGKPTIRATLDREDHMAGTASVGSFSVDFSASRTDKSAVEFRVTRSRKRTKDGRPVAPKVDDALEPWRPVFGGKAPVVVEAQTAGAISAVVKLVVDEFKLSLVLLDADEAGAVAAQLSERKEKVGVVPPATVLRNRPTPRYNESADLSGRGVRIALQSDSEDGARTLPLVALFAVRQGLGGDDALRALTVDAARMYGLDDRIGTLEPGKDADLLIHTGHPFDAGSRLERVLINGREVPDEDDN